ncbi:hypothetical protein [Clostridium tetani]|uniref:AraC family transcriptional regulator n=1 Tax=Clostridium tetani TaxID=1513 RepID=A0ABY0ES00_CLOTA|nr:hypothetical protein [Clostridium tetani]CDI48994.1 hypothetical protein BN906_00984 [Clostridium tetani 12124569]KHO39554.1 hypothetical protein OR62_04655 [Clostridium tetani]RXI38547.1 hypothetical protein DP129_09965 [Clostridium tetani]RXI55353.1 hypothetical protein DP131_08110 [Clostridium tetani]RXI68424.1 hypothetical protein DQN76_09150 [Clostridium tetani]
MINKVLSSKLFENFKTTEENIKYLKDFIYISKTKGKKHFSCQEFLENKIIFILDGSLFLNFTSYNGCIIPLKIY